MSGVGPFDLLETPLLRGTSLLEASAGTGKTYTLAGLFLRLLLEENLPAGQILVVTFTEAATEELRGRIRDLLVRAAEALRKGPEGGTGADSFLRGMVARAGEARTEWRRRVELALGGFDEASIYTIHGFCRRVLQERAFETGALFDSELIKETAPLLREVAEDYWRATLYGADPWSACLALGTGASPAVLGRWAGRLLQRRAEVELPVLGARAREEANALYVAMTRAEEQLVFSRTDPSKRTAGTSWWQRVQGVRGGDMGVLGSDDAMEPRPATVTVPTIAVTVSPATAAG